MHQESDYQSAERMLLDRARIRKAPANGSIELLPLCNMNCDMCYVRLTREEAECVGHIRSRKEWLSLICQMQEAGVLFLLLTGGEPLLYPEFRELMRDISDMGMIVTVNTNGTLIDEDWADFFASCRPRRVNITLYGTDNQTYEELCHYKNGFDKTVNAIRLLRERNVDVKIGCTVTRKNIQDISRIYQLGQELGAPVVLDSYVMPASRERTLPFEEQIRLMPEEAARVDVLQTLHENSPEGFENLVHRAVDIYRRDAFRENTDTHMSCMAGSCSFAVNWTGNLKPCVITPVPEANAFDLGFAQAWAQIRDYCDRLTKNKTCLTCPVQHLCPTCPVAELLEEGAYGKKPDYLCRFAYEKLRIFTEMERTGKYDTLL